jgi:hypothetical protein
MLEAPKITAAAMQQNLQQREQRRPRGRPFPKGQSGNPGGSRLIIERRAKMEAEIAHELGDDLSATDRILLSRAVELLTRRTRSHTDSVRGLNTAHRILQSLRAKYQAEEIAPSLQELLAGAE